MSRQLLLQEATTDACKKTTQSLHASCIVGQRCGAVACCLLVGVPL